MIGKTEEEKQTGSLTPFFIRAVSPAQGVETCGYFILLFFSCAMRDLSENSQPQ